MSWLYLIVVGLFEVIFTFCLGKAKHALGKQMYLLYFGCLIALILSMGLLIKANEKAPMGTAYLLTLLTADSYK